MVLECRLDTSLRVSVGIIVRTQSSINKGGQDGMGRWRSRAWYTHWNKKEGRVYVYRCRQVATFVLGEERILF